MGVGVRLRVGRRGPRLSVGGGIGPLGCGTGCGGCLVAGGPIILAVALGSLRVIPGAMVADTTIGLLIAMVAYRVAMTMPRKEAAQ